MYRQGKESILFHNQNRQSVVPLSDRCFYKSLQIRDVLVTAHVYLGQALFRQAKYAESVGPYEKVREMERSGNKLSSDQHRIVVDQLSMAYGISGDLKKARALLEDAIRQDPEYPINL